MEMQTHVAHDLEQHLEPRDDREKRHQAEAEQEAIRVADNRERERIISSIEAEAVRVNGGQAATSNVPKQPHQLTQPQPLQYHHNVLMKEVGFIGQHELCNFTQFVYTNQTIDDQATRKAGGLAEQQLAKSFSLSEINDPK